MAVSNQKRANTVLYIDLNDINSHRLRIILAEKSVSTEIIPADTKNLPEELIRANPYGALPTLIDRDLVLYEAAIIAEYLDERYPHPPLLPVYPLARAKSRLMMHRLEKEWYPLVKRIKSEVPAEVKAARKLLIESLVSFAPIFGSMPYFLSEEFSLLDCCVIPILTVLPQLGINLPPQAKAIDDYALRMSARPSFASSTLVLEVADDFV